MLRLLMLPIILPLALIWAIIQIPITLFYTKKIMDIEEGAKQDIEDLADQMDAELGKRICRSCLKNNKFRCSSAPERQPSSEDPNCIFCRGTGLL